MSMSFTDPAVRLLNSSPGVVRFATLLAALTLGCVGGDLYPDMRAPEEVDIIATELRAFDSEIPAALDSEGDSARVYYKIYRAGPRFASYSDRPLRRCYVQHGYGISPGLLRLVRYDFDAFISAYYGRRLVQALLRSACAEVIFATQETAESTLLEMTLRTEKFASEVACPPDDDSPVGVFRKNCAYIGHSKGGATAFNIARRCMQRTSTMGEAGCARLDEIYSAQGVVQGTLSVFLLYGLLLDDSAAPDVYEETYGAGPAPDNWRPGENNPVWLDVGPMAQMENGAPLARINNIALKRSGWLRADFAASGGVFEFDSYEASPLTYGCGAAVGEAPAYLAGCRSFGDAISFSYLRAFIPPYQRAVVAVKGDARFVDPASGRVDYLGDTSWARVRRSDGLVDSESALAACRKGLAQIQDRTVQSCTELRYDNHWAGAGGGAEARLDIVQQLVE